MLELLRICITWVRVTVLAESFHETPASDHNIRLRGVQRNIRGKIQQLNSQHITEVCWEAHSAHTHGVLVLSSRSV